MTLYYTISQHGSRVKAFFTIWFHGDIEFRYIKFYNDKGHKIHTHYVKWDGHRKVGEIICRSNRLVKIMMINEKYNNLHCVFSANNSAKNAFSSLSHK
jgi:hypothetical protein